MKLICIPIWTLSIFLPILIDHHIHYCVQRILLFNLYIRMQWLYIKYCIQIRSDPFSDIVVLKKLWMNEDSRWLSNCVELKHINGVHVSTTHDMLYCGSENVYQVWCGAFCEMSIPSFVSIIIFLPLHCLHDSLEANGTRLHCFSVWVFYEMLHGMV